MLRPAQNMESRDYFATALQQSIRPFGRLDAEALPCAKFSKSSREGAASFRQQHERASRHSGSHSAQVSEASRR
jgi:hypothetical protein